MDDLGRAATGCPDLLMLGGGNPAEVPEVRGLLRNRIRELVSEEDTLDRALGTYDPPQGNPRFLEAMAALLRREFGWPVEPSNIAVTVGGQTAFFCLFNLLAGTSSAGRRRKILLALCPEYIGYAAQGLEEGIFVACRPDITWPEGPSRPVFKYQINFSAVEEALKREDIAAIAASRPTNPTGNVLSDEEVSHLSRLAAHHGVPLILDGAYGPPFPDLSFKPIRPFWQPHVILTLSLSKLGLPGVRTGIVVAPREIVSALASFTAIMGLANPNLGQQLVLPWIEDGSILEIGRRFLQPFYAAKSRAAAAAAADCFCGTGLEWALHAAEGTFFRWLWLRNLGVNSRELYERLKARKVLTVPGDYFFFGLAEDWPHRHECLRLNIGQPEGVVRQALTIIADEAARHRRPGANP